VLDAMLAADAIEHVDAVARGRAVTIMRRMAELDAVIGKDRVMSQGTISMRAFRKALAVATVAFSSRRAKANLLVRSIATNKCRRPSAVCTLGDADMEMSDRIGLEALLPDRIALQRRQAADAVALQTAVQR